MKIGLNASVLYYPIAGIRTYVDSLASAFLERDDVELSLFSQSRDVALSDFEGAEVFHAQSKVPNMFWERFRLGRIVSKSDVEIFHGPNFVLPPQLSIPSVVTVHDLAYHYFPESLSAQARLYYSKLLPGSLRAADQVIVISEFVKHQLLELFPEVSEKVDVVYNGVGADFFELVSDSKIKEVLDSHTISSPYIFTAHTIEPRKNLDRLLDSFEVFRQNNSEVQLVVAGMETNQGADLIERMKNAEGVHYVGFVSKEDLHALYAGSELFMYLSEYEGFGLPVLEAMAHGVPVITSSGTAMEEVGSDSVVSVKVSDVDAIVQAMVDLQDDAGKRSLMSEMGRKRATEFTWDVTAARTVEVYEKLNNRN